MPDSTFLSWPFLDAAHRELAEGLRAWTKAHASLFAHHAGSADDACRALVPALAAGGWLRYTVPAPYGGALPRLDVRSLCIARETLAYASGLADFAFAMQG